MAATRQAPMISIPLKSTDDVDFITPLRQYIRGFYGSSDKFTEECGAINRMRQDMRGAGKDEMGRNLLYRYYGQLELLELRFPIDEEHVRVSFNWCDAFTEISTSQHSLAYEKACVLFNIAAILSFTASTQTRSEVDGMKKAFHSLQACAGLLNFINENFLHAPSTDLSRETVKTISTIMLAQAQEVFTEKQIRDGGKNSIIAKLAAETANLYHIANESLTELVIAGTIDSIWGSFCQIKEKLYSALAQFYQAGFDEEKGKYGTAVARLTVAQTLLKDTLQTGKNYSGQFARYPYLSNDPGAALTEVLKGTIEIVNEKAATVTKENDVIYHDAVPKESALATIPKLASAKPISLHDLYKGQDVARIIGHDIFHKLVPLSIHESASMYSEEIDKLLRAEQERSDIADTELTTTFDYLGLPKSLHQFKMSDGRMAQELSGAPDSLQALAAVVARGEQEETLASRLSGIRAAREKISATIAHASRSLDEEARQCEAMRSKFFEVWTQEPSQAVNSHWRDDLRQYRDSLDAATKSDQKIQDEFRLVQREIELLGARDTSSLDECFQEIVSRASSTGKSEHNNLLDLGDDEDESNAIAIKVDQVDDAMRKLNLVKKERLQTLQDLKEKARKDDISEVLILNKKTPEIEQRVFATELEKFNSHRTRISATISRQEQLLEEMSATFAQVLENKKDQARQQRWAKASQDRAKTIKAMEYAGKVYEDLCSGVLQATNFYNELIRLTNALAGDIKTFVHQRQNEGRALLERTSGRSAQKDSNSLREQLERMSLAPGNSSRYDRPAPPPPPHQSYSRPY